MNPLWKWLLECRLSSCGLRARNFGLSVSASEKAVCEITSQTALDSFALHCRATRYAKRGGDGGEDADRNLYNGFPSFLFHNALKI